MTDARVPPLADQAAAIRDALHSDKPAEACDLFDRLRTEHPEQALDVAVALRGGAR